MRTTLVFVPGFKGSQLVDRASGRTRWLEGRQVLFGGTRSGLALSGDRCDVLREGPVLADVRLAGLVVEAVYAPMLRVLASWSEVSVHTFPYDWRLDCRVHGDALHARLRALRPKTDRLFVIAHSTGGLVSTWALSRPESIRVDGLVTLAVPFRGVPKVFRAMQIGDDVGPNGRLLAPEVLGTFRSIYQLLPHDGSMLHDFEDRPLPESALDPEVWRRYRLGVFRDGRTSDEAASAHVRARLDDARTFWRQLDDAATCGALPAGMPILNVLGDSRPTAAKVFVPDGPPAKDRLIVRAREVRRHPRLRRFSLDQPGDGTVPAASAQLPDPVRRAHPHDTVTSLARHAAVPNDPSVLARIRAFVQHGVG